MDYMDGGDWGWMFVVDADLHHRGRRSRVCGRPARLLRRVGATHPTFPPFAGTHADRVLVDCRLVDHEQLVLEAGTHDASLRMRTSDLLDLTKGQVLDICQD